MSQILDPDFILFLPKETCNSACIFLATNRPGPLILVSARPYQDNPGTNPCASEDKSIGVGPNGRRGRGRSAAGPAGTRPGQPGRSQASRDAARPAGTQPRQPGRNHASRDATTPAGT